MDLLAIVQRAQGFEVFDVSSPSTFQVTAKGVAALAIFGIVVRILVAVTIYRVAADLKAKCEGPVVLPPSLWGLLCLVVGSVGQVLVVALFISAHFTKWMDTERAWRPRILDTGRESRHSKKVDELQAELEALRAKNKGL